MAGQRAASPTLERFSWSGSAQDCTTAQHSTQLVPGVWILDWIQSGHDAEAFDLAFRCLWLVKKRPDAAESPNEVGRSSDGWWWLDGLGQPGTVLIAHHPSRARHEISGPPSSPRAWSARSRGRGPSEGGCEAPWLTVSSLLHRASRACCSLRRRDNRRRCWQANSSTAHTACRRRRSGSPGSSCIIIGGDSGRNLRPGAKRIIQVAQMGRSVARFRLGGAVFMAPPR